MKPKKNGIQFRFAEWALLPHLWDKNGHYSGANVLK
jgi:hypothetical protein